MYPIGRGGCDHRGCLCGKWAKDELRGDSGRLAWQMATGHSAKYMGLIISHFWGDRLSFVSKILLVAFLLGFAGVASDHPAAYAQSKGERVGTGASGARSGHAIIAMTNKERSQHGLSPLKIDRACTLAIVGHVSDMASGRYLSHQGRDGRGASERYRRYNPGGRGAGENVAYNTYGTASSFMQQWLRSPAHRANILNPIYKGIGAAVHTTCSGRRCYYYAGQCFSL